MRSAAACSSQSPTGGNTAPTAPPEFTGGRKQKVNGKGGLSWTGTYHGRPLSRATLSVILRNPIYVMADLDIYEFYKSQGTDIYNDAADFVGTNGCYYYQGKGNTENKHKHLQGQTLVLAPHEGFIPSELWLKCRKKLLASHTYQPARKAWNTWTAGLVPAAGA